MSEKRKIYIASPFGFSEAGRHFMYNELIPLIASAGYIVLDPWKLTPPELTAPVMALPFGEEKRAKWEALNKTIASKNTAAIHEADGVVAVLDGVDIDSGTASEIGYATALKKPCIGYRGDFRLSADNEGSIVNLQVEYFIHLYGGSIVTEMSKIPEAMKKTFT